MSEVLQKVREMSDAEELRRVMSVAKQRLSNLATMTIKMGDHVQLLSEHQGKRPYDAIGVVKKVNQKTFKIDFDGKIWIVPKTMVKKV